MKPISRKEGIFRSDVRNDMLKSTLDHKKFVILLRNPRRVKEASWVQISPREESTEWIQFLPRVELPHQRPFFGASGCLLSDPYKWNFTETSCNRHKFTIKCVNQLCLRSSLIISFPCPLVSLSGAPLCSTLPSTKHHSHKALQGRYY